MGNYKMIYKNGKMVPEHRVIMEQILGRPLTKEEIVHHINGNAEDNNPENLELCANHAEHRKKHVVYGTPAHMFRLYIEDEEKIKAKYGKVTSAIVRDLLHEYFMKIKK